jgi:hypothetical protein
MTGFDQVLHEHVIADCRVWQGRRGFVRAAQALHPYKRIPKYLCCLMHL